MQQWVHFREWSGLYLSDSHRPFFAGVVFRPANQDSKLRAFISLAKVRLKDDDLRHNIHEGGLEHTGNEENDRLTITECLRVCDFVQEYFEL